MAGRSYFAKLIPVLTALSVALAACTDAPSQRSAKPEQSLTVAELELRKQARAMRRTILEGAALGGAAGLGLSIGLGGDEGTGFTVGAGAGAAAGTYVAAVQQRYARRARRLKQIQTDLDRNAAEMQAALTAMRLAAAQQKSELAAIKTRSAAGGSSSDLTRETDEARANLQEMEAIIQGAAAREEEFAEARRLTKRRSETVSPIDGDLATLAGRIQEMKQVAADLASDI